MRNKELEKLTTWRYCNIKNGEKIPYENGWQKNPHTLNNIHTNNVGVVLGALSGGICAIDFDGEEAIDHWTQTFNLDISSLNTVMWTSGKEYRCQAAFTVPEDYWTVLKRKVINKLEFRWTNCQSILPPSTLNDGRTYMWINSPDTHNVQQLPECVLVYWLNLILEEETKYDNVTSTYTPGTEKQNVEFVNEILQQIQYKVGQLKGDYDVWRTIAWATCSAVGINDAKMLMTYYWPYKTNKEIKTLLAWKHNHKGPSIGTLIKLSGISKKDLYELNVKYGLKERKKIKGIDIEIYNFNRN